jgi:hypothetical protein
VLNVVLLSVIVLSFVLLSVIVLNVVLLSGIVLNVVLLSVSVPSVMAPFFQLKSFPKLTESAVESDEKKQLNF